MDKDDNFSTITDAFVDLDIDTDDMEPDITSLSQEEIKEITNVIEKDKTLRREERKRRKKLEDWIDEKIIEMGLKNIDEGDKHCFNCGEKFKFWINPRKLCSDCLKGICNGCTYFFKNDDRTCHLCYLKSCKELKTGKWFAVISKQNRRFRRNPTAVLVNSMRKLKSRGMPTMTIDEPEHEPLPNSINGSRSISRNISRSVSRNISRNPSRNESKNESRIESRNNSQNASMASAHIPIYNRKEQSPTLKEKIVTVIDVPNENPIDIGDANSVEEIDGSKSIENKGNTWKQNNHLHPSNLENMKNVSASSNSIYSETYESYKSGITISGDISFSVYYDESNKSLNIYVDQCRNLAVADRNKRQSNPYIKTYLLPDKTKMSKHKSTSKKGNLNPVFKETLTYYVDRESLQNRTLSVAVWHKRFMTYNYFLGEVHILLADMDLSNKEPIWYPLMEKVRYPNRSGGHIYKGELIIKLKYKPSTRKDGKGSLHVLIVEAQQLESDGQALNAYVKGYLLPDRSNKTKKKTQIQKSTQNIKWDSLLQFTDVTLEDLKDRALELSIYHNRRLKSNEFLGGVRLNLGLAHVPWMDAQGTEKSTWESFLSNPNEYTEAILSLRPNLEY